MSTSSAGDQREQQQQSGAGSRGPPLTRARAAESRHASLAPTEPHPLFLLHTALPTPRDAHQSSRAGASLTLTAPQPELYGSPLPSHSAMASTAAAATSSVASATHAATAATVAEHVEAGASSCAAAVSSSSSVRGLDCNRLASVAVSFPSFPKHSLPLHSTSRHPF